MSILQLENVFWPRFLLFLLSLNSVSQIKERGGGLLFGSLRDQHFQKVSPRMTLDMYIVYIKCPSKANLSKQVSISYAVGAQLLDQF